MIDVAEIRACLDGRAVDFGLPDATHIYYGLSENPAADGGRAELRQYFYHLSFIENKALAQATSIYLYLLSAEPEVASKFRFYRLAPAPFVRFDDILNPDDEPLERHWIPGGPEADSCVFIDRGSGPVRVLFFVRQLPVEALVRIKRRFDEAGQAFELW